jgi:glutaconate CoA-transferase subunit A
MLVNRPGYAGSCAMSKVVSMRAAISNYVKSGDTLFLGGMQHGEPSAAIHEIVRQKIDHLKLVSALVTTSNLLVGEGLLVKLFVAYIFQDVKRSYLLGKAKARGRLPVFEEYSHFGISLALFAGQMGVPYLPSKSHLGSDFFKYNPNIMVTRDPFSGADLCAIKAIVPDVGIIHCQRCDTEGNAQRWGSMGVDVEGINASRKVIITTEKIVDSEVIRRDPNRTIIPGFRVSAVVEQPWGAHPMHLAGCYADDMWGYYGEVGKPEGYENYVNRLVYGLKNWDEYLQARKVLKGEHYFDNLRIQPIASEPVYTGFQSLAKGA